MIHCLIIDDEPYARKLLEEFISKTPDLRLLDSCSSALKAREVLAKKKIDLIFLDIQMPDLTGIDFLRSYKQPPAVIITTAYAEFALEGFELNAIDYLLKPFDFNRFLKAINKVNIQRGDLGTFSTNTASDNFIFVKDSNKLVRVNLDSVLYIKGAREYVTIVTSEKKITSLQSMKSLEEDLPQVFMRIHNSYIINTSFITEVHRDDVLINNELLPIGISYKKNFMERVKEKLRE
jgi:two-component system, LytTR family, response regulator